MANLDLLFNARNGITVGNGQYPIADNLGNMTPLTLTSAGSITVASGAWLTFGGAGTLWSTPGAFVLQAPDTSTSLTLRNSVGTTWGIWGSAGLYSPGYVNSTSMSTTTLNATNGYLTTLAVSSTSTLAGILYITNATGSSSPTTGALVVAGGVGIAGSLYVGTQITSSGDVTALSDARLKSNVQTVDKALDKVDQLRGVYYDKDGKRGLGVIAQEVQRVLPEVVSEGEEYLSVAYGNMVAVLIEAIKELREEVNQLKATK